MDGGSAALDRPGGRRLPRARAIAALILVVLGGLVPAAVAVSAADTHTLTSLTVSGSPFSPAFAPLPTHATIRVALSRRARVTITVRTLDGTKVKTLARRVRLRAGERTFTWDGRNAAGAYVPDGRYVVLAVAVNSFGTERQERPVRKGLPPIFPANPGAIVVALDPGHGGVDPGANYDGFSEEHPNLTIALHLRDLLATAGVQVVMTRTADEQLNIPRQDVNGDGVVDMTYPDEHAARNDLANLARADVYLHIHNNAYGCNCVRGTETYTSQHRSWTPQGHALATAVHREQIAALESYRGGEYFPVDRGVRYGSYYYMDPYNMDPSAGYLRPRPVLMPSILTESLFVDQPLERALLARQDVLRSLAAAMYIGIAEYLNARSLGIGYELVSGPAQSVAAGSPLEYRVRVTNRGNTASLGWMLDLRSVPRVPVYDGSGAPGALIGSAVVPDGLAPGASIEVVLPATAPADAGDWLVKLDTVLPGGTTASAPGVVAMQVALTTTLP